MVEMLTIDPNVRLLKMLGEDLIKDEKTAIIELIKNSYDADATKVKVFFINFDSDYSLLKNSEIIIVDNGQGMSKDIIKNDWLSPGTANKKKKKKAGEKTSLGRVYQGEKGIGRYSMLKLARTVELYSKPKDDSLWNYAKLDLSNFDKDFTNEVYESNLLSELKIPYMEEKTHAFNELSEYIEKQGTIIRLTNLNGSWNSQKVTDVYNDLARLEPITKIINKWNEDLDINLYFENFDIRFYQDGFETNHRDTFLKELKEFLKINEEKCLISINDGFFNDRNGEFKFNVNGVTHSVNLGDTKLKKLVSFKRSVFKEFDNFTFDNLSCGPFNFEFYFFNFDKNKKTKEHLSKHILSNEEKKLVEKHRIYLYRDSARVYPYGEEDNDWLGIDALRGLSKANQFFSNDQTVGFISISYEHNPQLQDKTNREGLIEEGNSTKQFISLIQIILNYIRTVINLEVDENLKKKKREEQQEQTKGPEQQEQTKGPEQQEQTKGPEQQEQTKGPEQQEQTKGPEQQGQTKGPEQQGQTKGPEQQGQTKGPEQQELDSKQKDVKEHELAIQKKEEELKRREDFLNAREAKLEDDLREELITKIKMENKEVSFFSASEVLKCPFSEEIVLNYNKLLDQLIKLKYEQFYLVYNMAFRVLIEDIAKVYITGRGLDQRKALGEKVNIVIEDLLSLVNKKKSELSNEQIDQLTGFMGGLTSYKNELNAIKDEFYESGKQGKIANLLNSFAHNPKWISREDAVSIANNKILPIMFLTQKVISFLEQNNNRP